MRPKLLGLLKYFFYKKYKEHEDMCLHALFLFCWVNVGGIYSNRVLRALLVDCQDNDNFMSREHVGTMYKSKRRFFKKDEV